MCIEILTIFCLCTSKRKCCLCIPNKVAHGLMFLTDFIECLLTVVAYLWVYQSARNWRYQTESSSQTFLQNFWPYGNDLKVAKSPQLQSMLLVIILLNAIPLAVKLVGCSLRIFGCCRLWTRKSLYISRVISLCLLTVTIGL